MYIFTQREDLLLYIHGHIWPRKWHQGADTASRNPTLNPSDSTISTHQNASDMLQKITSHIQALDQQDKNSHPNINNYTISTKLEQECISDPTYQLLASIIENGFPKTQQQLD